MQKTNDIYTVITTTQCVIIFSALTTASFGVVVENTYLAFFWYLALAGIVLMILTSFVFGLALIVTLLMRRVLFRGRAKRLGPFSRPKGARV